MRKAIMIAFASLMLFTAASYSQSMSPSQKEARAKGVQPVPLLLNNYFVLFPGNSTPYIKEDHLMLPLRPFAKTIGANVTKQGGFLNLNANSNAVDAIDHIKKGSKSIIREKDLGAGLSTSPEVWGGILFVPVTSLLDNMRSYRWKVRMNEGRRALVITTPGYNRLLGDDNNYLAVEPPPIEAESAYPYFPLAILQDKLEDGRQDPQFRLTLTLQPSSELTNQSDPTTFQIIAVDKEGNKMERDMEWTQPLQSKVLAVQTPIQIQVDIPSEAEYVLFHAEPKSKSTPLDPTDPQQAAKLNEKLGQLLEGIDKEFEVFNTLGYSFVGGGVEDSKMYLQMRKLFSHREVLNDIDKTKLTHFLYDSFGRTFPLTFESIILPEQPKITGTIEKINNKTRSILVVSSDNYIRRDPPLLDAIWGSFEYDASIMVEGTDQRLAFEDLKVGQKVKVWTVGIELLSYPGQSSILELQIEDVQSK